MGNILTLLGLGLIGAGTVLNIFAERKPAVKVEDKPVVKEVVKSVTDPVKDIIG